MTNVYLTTLVCGFGAVGTSVTGTVCSTVDAGKAAKEFKKGKEDQTIEKKLERVPTTTDLDEFVDVLRYINPDAEIRKTDPKKDPYALKRIFVSSPTGRISLPTGFKYDRNLGITNKDNIPANGSKKPKYLAVKIENLATANPDILLTEEDEEELKPKLRVRKDPYKDLLSTTVSTAAITITGSILSHNAYADTYDAKTYMDAMSDQELAEFCEEIERTNIDDLDKMLVLDEKISADKKLVK